MEGFCLKKVNMKVKKGYLMLEVCISMGTMFIIISIIYWIFFSSLSIYKRINSSVEIQQQGIEIQGHVEKELCDGIEIISVKTRENNIINSRDFDITDVISIKYKPINRDVSLGLDELYLNTRSNKIFIKRRNAASGYEIGDYLDNIYISKKKDGKIVNIELKLSKNTQKYFNKFTMYQNQKM